MNLRKGSKVAGDCDSLQMESKTPEQTHNIGQKNGEIMESEEVENGKSEPIVPVAMDGPVTAPDGGWGWVVLVSTILVQALTLGFSSCIGIFFTDLQTEFQASNQETSWVPSIMTSVLHAGGPFCSVMVERFGCRTTVMVGGVLSGLGMAASSFTHTITELYVTAGVITGLGFCFSFQPAVTILGHYFVRRRAFANAMSSTGTALGLCTLPLLGNYLHTELGWRGSFLVLGAVLLNCCVCGAVMRPLWSHRHCGQPLMNHGPLQPEEEKPKGSMRALWGGLKAALHHHMAFDLLCNNLRYRVFSVGITWMMLGFLVPLIYIVPYATAHDMEQSRAALLLSILGIVSVMVRPSIGLLFSLPWFKGRYIYVFSAAVLMNGLSNSICCIDASFHVLLVYVVTYGLSMSVVGSLMFTVLMDTLDMSRFPAALGLLAIMESVTLLIGPPLAGILVDRTGEYFYVFFACSATVASSAVFLMVSFYCLDRKVLKGQQVPPQVSPPKPASVHNVVPQCQYSSVPTKGDKDKASDSETKDVSCL
ncbi:monocarboxylate transporter 6 [Oncorhynchus kisutch]|uniref:Solute carrier family 16 member 5 n=1 Tax=Oncorhynchus kisutch TaxID=8019 RepID=A0A8C7G1V7_ONCKI|nr:monocarboxylate transporter 6 [Oncorhynchus kisutch]XP_020309912.1 monocarboxylate transporter 6 [Oncorhynchus kisutch]XP_031655131.1 monocarboxylate transporter 6 [Oncorhynchus kisutch]